MKIKALLLACILLINPIIASDSSDEEAIVEAAPVKKRKASRCEESVKNNHITYLDLSNERELRDINFVVYFPATQKLTLQDCRELGDNYSPVASLIHLTSLNLEGIRLTTLAYLRPLSHLTSLRVAFNRMTSLEGIEELPLRKLDLFGNIFLRDIDGLSSIRTLIKLNLGNIFIDHEDSKMIPKLEILLSLIHLRKLKLKGSQRISSISVLRDLPNLEYLDIKGSGVLSDVESLKDFPKLRELKIDDRYKIKL